MVRRLPRLRHEGARPAPRHPLALQPGLRPGGAAPARGPDAAAAPALRARRRPLPGRRAHPRRLRPDPRLLRGGQPAAPRLPGPAPRGAQPARPRGGPRLRARHLQRRPPLRALHLLRLPAQGRPAAGRLAAPPPARGGVLQHPGAARRLARVPGAGHRRRAQRRGRRAGEGLRGLLPHQPGPRPARPLRLGGGAQRLPRQPADGADADRLFRARFDPRATGREKRWPARLAAAEKAVRDYNTGHRHLDDVRRDVFRCCLAFIKHTLKTNFFVLEKQALAFRLDPAYLAELGPGLHLRPAGGHALPGHLLLHPLRLRLPHRLLRHRPRRLAHRHLPHRRRLPHQRRHPVPRELRAGPHPALQEQGHLRGRLQAGDADGRLGAGGRGARPGDHPPPQAAARRHQRLPRHLRHRRRRGPRPGGGRLLPRGRAHRARPRREHARRDDRGDRGALPQARLPARRRRDVHQAGRHQPQGVRGHLHRGGHLRRDHHEGAGHRHAPQAG